MSRRRVYEATAERDGGVWLVKVQAVDRVTQARRLDQAEAMARSLIAIMTGEPEASIEVRVTPRLEPALAELADTATNARVRAAHAQTEASAALRQAARTLSDAGLTIRDVGAILGVTHQRIAQLLSTGSTARASHR
jgi:hypothetical protein